MAKGMKTGGRKVGTPNKVTTEIRDIARSYAVEAMAELWRLAKTARSEQTRVAAIKELFDRGYGKAKQTVDMNAAVAAASKEQRDAVVAAALRAEL